MNRPPGRCLTNLATRRKIDANSARMFVFDSVEDKLMISITSRVMLDWTPGAIVAGRITQRF